jgi:hypothetical protein
VPGLAGTNIERSLVAGTGTLPAEGSKLQNDRTKGSLLLLNDGVVIGYELRAERDLVLRARKSM